MEKELAVPETVLENVLWPRFDKKGMDGKLPCAVQELGSLDVILICFVDGIAYSAMLATGKLHYYTRQKGRVIMKGRETGDTFTVHGINVNCNGDSLVVLVTRDANGICHTGARSCFYRNVVRGEISSAPNASQKEELPIVSHQVVRSLRRPATP